MSDADFSVHEVVVEVEISAPAEKVWHAITEDTTSWWPRDFYVNADSTACRIEARVGGHMLEDAGDGQGTVWGTITHVKKNESIRISAEMWPEYGGPARSIQCYALTETDEGTTLRFSDTMYGRVGSKAVASMKQGWSYLMGKALKNYVETGEHPPASSPLDCSAS